MKRTSREFLRRYSSLFSPIKPTPLTESPSPTRAFPRFTLSSTASSDGGDEKKKTSPKSQRDSLLLEKFRLRKLKGSSSTTTSQGSPPQTSSNKNEDDPIVTDFGKLGLIEELVEVLGEIGVLSPSEIQCVGIPAILERKSVLLSSVSGHHRTLAYLLPLIQLLRQEAKMSGSNTEHPRAIVLCATEEKAEECFNAAKYIIHHAELKSAKDDVSPDNEQSNVSIGLVIEHPSEILRYIEEGTVIPDEIRYLVMDDADSMFDSSLGPEIHKIIRPLRSHSSESTARGLQTVLVTSTITEILGEESPIIKHLENNHAGKVSSIMLEMESTEIFHLTESQDALRKKLIEAMNSLL